MNLDAIKKKLESMQKTTNSGGNNYPKSRRFKPSVGKQTVRVVPFKYNKDYPFTEMKFYYGIGSRKVIASPLNWGEKDPIAEFAKQLRGTNEKENWRLAKKLDPKTRIFAPVIVRGEEAEGVQMWEFGKEIYEAFLQMASDEEVGDFTDIVNGRDIKLTTVGPDTTGTPYNRTTISPSMKQTQLSSDSDFVKIWLDDQQNPKETYKPLPFDDIKAALQEWLAPEDEEDGESNSGVDVEKNDSNYSLSTNEKKTKVDKFDEMFDEDSPF
jgi:hypothetical protein